MIFFSTLLISMFATIALIPFFRHVAVRVNAVDVPNDRKVHHQPMPKSGGIAMALGTLIPLLLWAPINEFVRAVLVGSLIIVIFGLMDDIKKLGYKDKFIGQIAASLIVIFYGGIKIRSLGMLLPPDVLLPDWLAIPLTIMVIVGVTNAINLSDGLDGLAGGISLLGFLCIGYLAYREENIIIVLFSVAVAGAILGFLRFNTYPATLFMGDAGSQFLGFLAVTLSLSLTQGNTPLSPLLPLILLGFPVLDTLTVMCERIANGRPPFAADRNHLHHKLIRLGFFHTEAVLVIYVLQVFLVTSAFIFRFYPAWAHLILYIGFSGLILCGFFVADRTGWKLKRFDLVDKVIKGRLRVLKENNVLIKVSYRVIKVGIPSLMLFACFLPTSVPGYFSLLSMGLIVFILVTWVIKKEWMGVVLQLTLYLLIPFVTYLSQADMASWVNESTARLYNLSFGFLAFFAILTVKFTRRRKGFKSTPTDFLVIFIALVVPALPDEYIRSHHLGLLAAKIIVLFFSYEILIGELRGELKEIGLATIAALVVIGVRGLV